MKYICIEGFTVEMFDDDGFTMDRYMDIEAGEVYSTDDSGFHMVGGNDTIRLESISGKWIELSPETVSRYFASADKEENHGREV